MKLSSIEVDAGQFFIDLDYCEATL